jgi:hypothetical protein
VCSSGGHPRETWVSVTHRRSIFNDSNGKSPLSIRFLCCLTLHPTWLPLLLILWASPLLARLLSHGMRRKTSVCAEDVVRVGGAKLLVTLALPQPSLFASHLTLLCHSYSPGRRRGWRSQGVSCPRVYCLLLLPVSPCSFFFGSCDSLTHFPLLCCAGERFA